MIQYKTFTFYLIEEHTYLLWDETGEACVVDAGMYRDEEREEFDRFLKDHHLRLTRAIHTHLHFDHFIGAKWIEETYGVKPEAPQIDIDNKIQLSSRHIQMQNEIGQVVVSTTLHPLPEEGGEVKFGNSTLKILSVPGHTPGHAAFYSREAGLVIAGDVLFRGDIGRTDLWKGDYRQLLDSIHTRLFTLPSDTKVLPGHGPETTIGEERATFRYS